MPTSINFTFAIQAIIILLISIDIHELSHALTATALGDPTPARSGQLSLNPFVHMDQIGILLLFITSLLGTPITWGRTFVQPQNLKFGPQRGGAIVAIAGPLSNLLLAILLGVVLRLIVAGTLSAPANWIDFIYLAFAINLVLFAFNVVPLPPLDGFTILSGFLTTRMLYRLDPIRQYGPLLLFLLFVFPSVLCATVYRLASYVGSLIFPSISPLC
jgi:Zn-dependent protease